jgi:hypothetical protein
MRRRRSDNHACADRPTAVLRDPEPGAMDPVAHHLTTPLALRGRLGSPLLSLAPTPHPRDGLVPHCEQGHIIRRATVTDVNGRDHCRNRTQQDGRPHLGDQVHRPPEFCGERLIKRRAGPGRLDPRLSPTGTDGETLQEPERGDVPQAEDQPSFASVPHISIARDASRVEGQYPATSASAITRVGVTRTKSSPGTALRRPNSSARSAPM